MLPFALISNQPLLLILALPDAAAVPPWEMLAKSRAKLRNCLDISQEKYLAACARSCDASWAIGRHLLRLLVCEATGESIITEKERLPALKNGWRVSFSYGAGLAFALLTPPGNGRIGIDAEPVFGSEEAAGIKNFFSRFLDGSGCPENCGLNNLTRLWTVYESAFKLWQDASVAQEALRLYLGRQKNLAAFYSMPFSGHWLTLAMEYPYFSGLRRCHISWQALSGMSCNADF